MMMQELHAASFPMSPDDAYNKIVRRIESKGKSSTTDLAFLAISWVLHAKRPLRLGELREAVVFQHQTPSLPLSAAYPDADEICSACKSLIVYDETNDVFQFVHNTVWSYFESRASSQLRRKLLSTTDVAFAALVYLNLPDWQVGLPEYLMAVHPFSIYLGRHWSLHLKGPAENSTEVQLQVYALLGPPLRRFKFLEIEGYAKNGAVTTDRKETLLHMITRAGLSQLCDHFLES